MRSNLRTNGTTGVYILKRKKSLFFWKRNKFDFFICTNELEIVENHPIYTYIAEKYNLKNILIKLIGNNDWIVLQGDCVFHQLGLKKPELFVTHLFFSDYETQDRYEEKDLVNRYGLNYLPIKYSHMNHSPFKNYDYLLKYGIYDILSKIYHII